jgi:ABC-type Mn2+/Zn2+ transport system ATPase subunit
MPQAGGRCAAARRRDLTFHPRASIPFPGMIDECIRVEGLRVVRDGALVLRDLSLVVGCAERLIVRGPNGAGKTTLLKVLLGLVAPNSGRVLVLGEEVGSRPWSRRRHRVGYVNQEAVQVDFPVSGREVVEIGACSLGLPRQEKRGRIERAMEAAGCSHLAGRAYARLSGGEKQRLSLARCLCQEPELILLDEPTSFLDPRARQELMELVSRLNQQRRITVVMVSHDSQLLEAPGWRSEHMEAGAFA